MTNDQSSRQVVLPFRVGIDSIEKLLVANFRGDPEFDAIEPQVFDDAVNGKGMRVLCYRKDGKVDVYWQPGVRVDRKTFSIGAGIGDFAETTIEPAHFEITGRGVDLRVAFVDARGRKVELGIHEDAPGKRGFPLLAPIGASIAHPLQFFLVYMSDIDFVRRSGSVVEGRIGDRILRPASLPIPLRGHRVLLIRYATRPVVGVLNPPMDRPLVVELPVSGSVEVDGMLIAAGANGSIARISAGQEPRQVEVDFLPGFPNLLDFGGSSSGQWLIRIAGIPITGGTFDVSRQGGSVAVKMDVIEHWKPARLPLSVEILTRVLSMFRTWPSTYRWRGVVELGAAPTMSGRWERVRRGLAFNRLFQ